MRCSLSGMRGSVTIACVLLVTGAPGCALLYEFEGEGGRGGGGTGTSRTTGSVDGVTTTAEAASASSSASGVAPAPFEIDRCLKVGGAETDIPGRPGLALVGGDLVYVGLYDGAPLYWNTVLPFYDPAPPAMTPSLDGIVVVALDPDDFEARYVYSFGDTVDQRVFVIGHGTQTVLGGTFAHAKFDPTMASVTADANSDGFVAAYEGDASMFPPPEWAIGGGSMLGGPMIQGLNAAVRLGNGVVAGGIANQLTTSTACEEVVPGSAFGFLRALDTTNEACLQQRLLPGDTVLGAGVLDMAVSGGGMDPMIYVSTQYASPDTVYTGKLRAYDAALAQNMDVGTIVVGAGFNRVRVAADGARGAYYCATRYLCDDALDCGNAANWIPGGIVVRHVAADGTGTAIVDVTSEQNIECGAIAFGDGDLFFGGRFSQAATLAHNEQTHDLAALDPMGQDAYLVRIDANGVLTRTVVGGAGDQDITTILPGRPDTPRELFVSGTTQGPLDLPGCEGADMPDKEPDVLLFHVRLGQ